MEDKFYTFGDRVIHDKYIEMGCDAVNTSKHFCNEAAGMQPPKKGPNRHMVKAAFLRHENGETLAYLQRKRTREWERGRLPALDDVAIQAIKAEAEHAKNENRILRPQRDEAWARMKLERLRMVVRLGVETSMAVFDHSKYDLTERTMHNLAKLCYPEQKFSKHGTTRREAAKMEIRNAISNAAVAGSVFKHTNPDCIVTTDHMAIYIDSSDKLALTFAAAGSQESMRQQGLSIAAASPEEESEGNVKLPICCSMTMSGKLVSCVAEVWDDQLVADADGRAVRIFGLDPTDASEFLSAKTFVAYIAHGTPHDVVMYEIYTKVVIPKTVLIRDRAKALAALRRSGSRSGAFGPAPSVVRAFEGSVSSSTRSRTRANTSSQSCQSVSSSSTRQRSGVLNEAAAAHDAVQPEPFVAAVVSSPRRVVLDASSSDDDRAEETEIIGSWINDPAEFDIILALDGDSAPLAAFLDKQKMRSYCDTKHPHGRQTIEELVNTGIWGRVCLLKWAAGCSMIQSPNDVGKTHFILRNFVKWQSKKGVQKTVALTFNQCPPGLQAHYVYLHSPDIAITAARKRGFWRLLSNLPSAAAEAFRERVVRSSWALCGYYPLSTFKILDKCTLWKRTAADGGLIDEEKRAVFAAIPRLQDIAYNHGRVSDLEMLEFLPFLSRYPTDLKLDLADLAINRDRCCLVIHESYLAERARAGLAARASDPSLRAPKRAKVQAIARVEWEAWTAQSYRCTIKDIKEQLNMRGVALGRAKEKSALLTLWQTNTLLPDKRPAVVVRSAAFALPVVQPGALERLRAEQEAVPPTPPRR
jgi:hypothetical protein